MSISVLDRKHLWGRSHNQCAFHECSQSLSIDLADAGGDNPAAIPSMLGEEAHIRSGRPGGPRHDPGYPPDRIDDYANLILLCPTHHTMVDKDGGRGFTVEDLESMRRDHETAMSAAESAADAASRRLSERMAEALVAWEQHLGLDDWQMLTWQLNRPIPYLSRGFADRLIDTGAWLLARDWPPSHPHLLVAFARLDSVMRALTSHIDTSFELVDDLDAYQLSREYKRIPWNPDLYQELLSACRLDAMTTWVLTVELTRAANLVIAAARIDVDPLYRFDDGMLLARDGDGIFESNIVRIEFDTPDWQAIQPIPSLGEIREAILNKATELGRDPDHLDPYGFDL